MAYVTVHTLEGDPLELLDRKQRHFDPVVRHLAPAFGGIASVTTETETGLMIVNVWTSAEQVPAFTAHPDVRSARDSADLPTPSSFQRYEAASFEMFGSGAG